MATNNTGNTLSLFSLLDAVRRRKLFLILPTLLLGIAFSVYAYLQPNRYRAEVIVAAEHLTPPGYLREVAPQPLNIQEHLWTVNEVLYSPEVISASNATKDAIDVRIDSEHTFAILYQGDDPVQVADVLNKLSKNFVERASAKREHRVEETRSVIQEQIDALKQRFEAQDAEIREYKQKAANELPEHVDANIRAVDELRMQYRTLEGKIADDEAQRTAITREMRELEAKGALDQTVVTEKTPAQTRVDELKIKVQELKARYWDRHPDVLSTEREIVQAEKLAAAEAGNARSEPSVLYLRYLDLKSELDAIDARLSSYRRQQETATSQIATYQQRIESAPVHERSLDALTREMVVGESQFHELLDKQLDTNIAAGLEKGDTGLAFAIVQAAAVPSAPFSPQRERIILMGVFAGLGLGLVTAFLLEQNDTSFGNLEDFQAFTTMPVLGAIPTVDSAEKSFVTLKDSDSVAAEQYRILAMRIHQWCAQSGDRVVMITSAAGGEGKSITAINVSMALTSLVNGPVLLVDADMRKPRLHEYLDVPVPHGKGFHNLLVSADDDPEKHIVHVGGLDVVPGSAPASNPIAALASPKARVLMDRLKKQYRLIVVDAPPTLPVADSHMLSGLCDKVVFVVRARVTPRELFQHAAESFEPAHVLGVALNDVNYERTRYAYAYEYYRENYLARK